MSFPSGVYAGEEICTREPAGYSRVWKKSAFAKTLIVVNAHSCLLATYSLSYRWFFAPQFQTHTFLPKSFP